jgi:hypothetical protein
VLFLFSYDIFSLLRRGYSFLNAFLSFITENLVLHGEDCEEGWKSFLASQVSKCKHKHSPCLNELCGIGEER